MPARFIKIGRLGEFFPPFTREEIAETISKLIEKHGDGFVNKKTPEEIIDDPARYFLVLLIEFDNGVFRYLPIGCFAINIVKHPCAVLKSVVIRKEYRGIGLGKKIIEIATKYGLSQKPCIDAYVKPNNERMLHILTKLGYKITKKNDQHLKLTLHRDMIVAEILEHIQKLKI